MNPQITIHDVFTGETITREMTDAEYEQLLVDGWTPGDDRAAEETPAEEPASEE